MEKENFTIGSKSCISYSLPNPAVVLIQPASGDEEGFLDAQASDIEKGSKRPFILVSFHIDHWNKELSPWPADPVFGNESFGDGAGETLRFVTGDLLPYIRERFGLGDNIPVVLGGYSLAGLFSLWSMYNSDAFSAVCGVSPSVWFEGWDEYVLSNKPKSSKVYLSLGKKEEKNKNITMARVGDRIRMQEEILSKEGIPNVLEWNEGGHFNDPGKRCAKGFIWCLNNED